MRNLRDFTDGEYPVGLFYFDKELWTDAGVKQAAETGADFFVAVESSPALIELCEKYGLGILATSNVVPMWWGGDGSNAGGYAEAFPLEKLDEIIKTYPDSAALWGDYMVDEPNSKDFAHIDKAVKRYKELFSGKLPFINLYPNYASIPKNTGDEVVSQLGNRSYAEHIDQYVKDIDLPYICFDYYPFTGVFATYLENLETVASACKKNGKEMWVIIQTGAWKEDQILDAFQLDWQAYLCLAYGATSIIHASYSKGWWDESTSCVNLKGEKNVTYGYVKEINSSLHSLGAEFLKYKYLHTGVVGDVASSDDRIKTQLIRQGGIEKPVAVDSDKACVVGYFAEKEGGGNAVMIVNSHNPFDKSISTDVVIESVPEKTATLYKGGCIAYLTPDPDGKIYLTLSGGQGAFITFK